VEVDVNEPEETSLQVRLPAAAGAVADVWDDRARRGQVTRNTADFYRRQLDTFVSYAGARGVAHVDELTASICREWVRAPLSALSPGTRGRAGQPSAAATRRSRLVVLRQAVKVWSAHDWCPRDLLGDLVVTKNPPAPPCPLLPSEVTNLRRAGAHSRKDTLLPALVELALVGLNQAEIAALTVSAVDRSRARVAVRTPGDADERVVRLSEAAVAKIVRHIAALEALFRDTAQHFDPDVVPLGLHPSPRSVRDRVRPTAVGQHLYRALKLAGITRSGVTPGSTREYAANACYARTNRIEDVAAALGIVSLDAAFRLIDQRWQAAWASHEREREL
jgi:site-specific recombinase XerD